MNTGISSRFLILSTVRYPMLHKSGRFLSRGRLLRLVPRPLPHSRARAAFSFLGKRYNRETMTNDPKRAGQANKATIYFIVGFIVLVTAAVIVAAAYGGGEGSSTASSTFVATTVPAITSTDWQEGNPNAK